MNVHYSGLLPKAGIAVATAFALSLAACSTPNTSANCGIQIQWGKTTGQGQTKSRSLTSDTVSSLDAANMSATFNSSGGIISDSGVMTIQLLSGGTVIAQQQFGTNRAGNTFTASNPSSVNNWVRPFAGTIDEIDVTINNVQLQDVQGTNALTVSANFNGSSYASTTTTWQGLNYQHY